MLIHSRLFVASTVERRKHQAFSAVSQKADTRNQKEKSRERASGGRGAVQHSEKGLGITDVKLECVEVGNYRLVVP